MPALEQKITLITGSTKGIGAAIASAFVDNHAHVVVHGRDREEVAQATVFLAMNSAVNGSAQRVEGSIVRSI